MFRRFTESGTENKYCHTLISSGAIATHGVVDLWQIFGGLLVNITALGDWLSWLQYFSIARYSLNVRASGSLSVLLREA